MGVRKSVTKLSTPERDRFLAALLTLKNTIVNPLDPPALRISIYDQFAALHLYVLAIRAPGGPAVPVDYAHGAAGFGPWHRQYLLLFEQALQSVDATVTLPYWDWTDHNGAQLNLFLGDFMGPNGGLNGVGGGTVRSGYFAANLPGTPGNVTPVPAWWIPAWTAWQVRSDLEQGSGTTLRRFLAVFGNLATQLNVNTTLETPAIAGTPASDYNAFRNQLENGTRMHGHHHLWLGGTFVQNGHMRNLAASPNDPMFFLHHCNVDRLWAMWQLNGHQGTTYYPAAGQPLGHNLADPMWPWVGALPGYSSDNAQPNIVLPNFAALGVVRPQDVIDHRALGYSYDTEVTVGIALDQTGSMNGMTPDPLTGAGSVTKWEAAKRGVAAFLHDCASAHAAGEAYITAGVETFRSLPANTFTTVFAGTPYGLIRATDPVYSEAGFNTAIAAPGFTPNGGTPLTDALSDTETRLVRPPFGNLPAHETRYLMMLTDGMQTSGSLMSSLPVNALPDTLIFAMGFGVGSGWNGVDYTTLATLVSKGKNAPAAVTQVFHGDNAGTIDKFYSQSVAAIIGYTPITDPLFELFPGEHVDVPFAVTTADQSMLITAQGFDFKSENWQFCLITPDGDICNCDADCHLGEDHSHDNSEAGHGDAAAGVFIHTHRKVLVTSHKSNGRIAIFLNRNGAKRKHWSGGWQLRAMYKMDDDGGMTMVMPSVFDLVLPVGTPPLRGPVFSRFNLPPEKRPAVRLLPPVAKRSTHFARQGVATTRTDEACALSVNVFAKTTLKAVLTMNDPFLFAGDNFQLSLSLQDAAGATLSELRTVSRLTAPQFNIGNVFADLQTISLDKRNKYLERQGETTVFRELNFLADFENQKPGFFEIRDELLQFQKGKKGDYTAKVQGNKFPGIHRVGLMVEGVMRYGKGKPERFARVLHLEVPVGLRLDTKKSNAVLSFEKENRLVVSVVPSDKLGNIPSPARMLAPEVRINGVPVLAQHENPLTGEHRLTLRYKGDGFKCSSSGIVSGTAVFDTADGKKLTLKKGDKIQVNLWISGQKIPVSMKY